MQGNTWENQYRTTTVCIDKYDDGVLVGRIYNPYLSNGDSFCSTMEFLKQMEALLDGMRFPQPFSMNRVFRPPPETKPGQLLIQIPKKGSVATFSLKILFRQNASWQGSVAWVEGRREESFRSALELLFLMDSAMCTEEIEERNAKQTSVSSYGVPPYENPYHPGNDEMSN